MTVSGREAVTPKYEIADTPGRFRFAPSLH